MIIVYNTDQIYLHGGIEKVMATKANYFANLSNTEVYIITTEQKDNLPCYFLDEKIKLIDLKINYNRQKSYYSLTNLLKAFKHYWYQKKTLKKLNPDVIISPNFNFDFYWLPFLSKKAIKIKEIHNSRFNYGISMKNRLQSWFEKKYSAVVVLNLDEARYFNSSNVHVIPNPVKKSEFVSQLDNKKVIAAGRISPVKGFDQLIEAWEIVYQKFPDWQLHIYGDDYLNTKAKLENLLISKNLQHAIFFKGSTNDLPKKMTDYSLYLMSSVSECFPMVLLEALSVGLPIVAYDCPNGPRNIISHEVDGILVESQNVNALAKESIDLIKNTEKRKMLGNLAKLKSEEFDEIRIMPLWLILFNKIKKKERENV